ncbi:hypothetical protein EXE58_11640 [Nocardioides seonyuensis]|uniref:AbiEi antitoxin N-terminal domain-containing protein n=1 Tax=Nocardioides seonyuensis TaxID=2518371 RepID=A0A4P7IFJ4_9ACTN|nr:type IV toxin-antitoxin system AbiEi family antitoxin domain-containing protein [Nocardioides seonyuensis]QBX56049.1 hypothetical protein EXE58_11640 [Nocardioides seonyuensis]
MERLRPTLAQQHGVVSRAQALALGLEAHDVRRLVRRRELTPLFAGVYLDHTGVATWLQRAWGAVLFCGPRARASGDELLGAALGGASAMRAADGPGRGRDSGSIHVVVPRERRVTPPAGVEVVRTFGLADRVQWNLGPPRLRYDDAALDAALSARDDFAAIGTVARAVQSRHTTALRMKELLDQRARAPRRDFLSSVLEDVGLGTCSVLEHGYLHLIERPHGLPAGQRQHRVETESGVVYRDVAYGMRLVELDGRLWHDTAEQRDKDFERDLDAAVEGRGTVRLTYGQVFDRPCSTAAKIARLLESAGWPAGHACGPGCALAGTD